MGTDTCASARAIDLYFPYRASGDDFTRAAEAIRLALGYDDLPVACHHHEPCEDGENRERIVGIVMNFDMTSVACMSICEALTRTFDQGYAIQCSNPGGTISHTVPRRRLA